MSDIHCISQQPANCAPLQCRRRCALEVIDDLLSQPGAISGDEADRLLDLRWKVSRREDAEATLRLFCELRLRLEERHYLAFFRIRRWLENHLIAGVQPCQAAEPRLRPVKVDHFCIEAIRRASLCAVLSEGLILFAPRLRFLFRPVEEFPAEASVSHRNSRSLVTAIS
ncbi:MAG: hypothetical protein ACREF8_06340 [Chthoniobacterales bacterium]